MSKTITRAERARQEAEAKAAAVDAAVAREHYRKLRRWLAVAVFFSFVGNAGHAIMQGLDRAQPNPDAVLTDPIFWLSVFWAAVPPTLLVLAVRAVPIAAFFLRRSEDDPVLIRTAWAVTVAAFGWSAVGVFAFTVAVGVPPWLAWLAPAAIDLSVFGAERALVRAAPVMVALEAGHPPASQPPAEATASGGVSTNRPTGRESAGGSAGGPTSRPAIPPPVSRGNPGGSATGPATTATDRPATRPATAPAGGGSSDAGSASHPATGSATGGGPTSQPVSQPPADRPASQPATGSASDGGSASQLADRVISQLGLTTPREDVVRILSMSGAGQSARQIAELIGRDRATVGKIARAARELDSVDSPTGDRDHARQLAAVR